MTPAQVASATRRFKDGFNGAVLRGLTIGTRRALSISITKYMEPMSKNPLEDPPNPPPGPLARRRGRLARTGRIITPQYKGGKVVAGIEFGGRNGVRYARIHELGGMAGRGRKTYIPPRPYGVPAMREANVIGAISDEVNRLGARTCGQLWKPLRAA